MQEDWVDHLSMVKFAANNHINTSMRLTLFFADNGFHLCTDIEPLQTSHGTIQKAKLLTADKIIKNQELMASFLQNQLA